MLKEYQKVEKPTLKTFEARKTVYRYFNIPENVSHYKVLYAMMLKQITKTKFNLKTNILLQYKIFLISVGIVIAFFMWSPS